MRSNMSLFISNPSLCVCVLTALLFAISASAFGTGLSADYYDPANFTTLKFSRVDATVDFDWAAAAPTNTMGADTFSVRWYGQVEPRYSETYTFFVAADDLALSQTSPLALTLSQ